MVLVQAENLRYHDKCQHGFYGRGTDINDTLFRTVKASRVRQVHGNVCHVISEPIPENEWTDADALVTDAPKTPIGVITADCTPVLFYGETENGKPVIGAAHAGWQGALNGVLEETVAKMMEKGTTLSSIKAAVGPCICSQSYEVSKGFETPFLNHNPIAKRFFSPVSGKDDKWMFDLPCYCAFRLALCGVDHTEITGVDTLTNTTDFYSYRQLTQAGLPNNPRQISAIMISG